MLFSKLLSLQIWHLTFFTFQSDISWLNALSTELCSYLNFCFHLVMSLLKWLLFSFVIVVFHFILIKCFSVVDYLYCVIYCFFLVVFFGSFGLFWFFHFEISFRCLVVGFTMFLLHFVSCWMFHWMFCFKFFIVVLDCLLI